MANVIYTARDLNGSKSATRGDRVGPSIQPGGDVSLGGVYVLATLAALFFYIGR